MKDGKVLPLDQWTLTGKVAGGELIGANRVQVTGDYAIVGGSYSAEGRTQAEKARGAKVTGNMAVVNISDPAKPAIVAAVPFSDVRGPNGLTIAGKVVFCAGRQSVDAYDISDPEKPAHLAGQHFPRYKKDAKRTDNYHDLIYRDGYLYISAQTDNGFLVLRVNDKRIRKLADLK